MIDGRTKTFSPSLHATMPNTAIHPQKSASFRDPRRHSPSGLASLFARAPPPPQPARLQKNPKNRRRPSHYCHLCPFLNGSRRERRVVWCCRPGDSLSGVTARRVAGSSHSWRDKSRSGVEKGASGAGNGTAGLRGSDGKRSSAAEGGFAGRPRVVA